MLFKVTGVLTPSTCLGTPCRSSWRHTKSRPFTKLRQAADFSEEVSMVYGRS
jgi:hypothetical protein